MLAGPTVERTPEVRTAARWLLALAVLGLLLAELPLALAWCCGPRDLAGLGTLWFVNDFAQYEAAIDQGARSSGWLIYNRFTPEAHQPALLFPFYVALGKVAALTGLPWEVVYRATELLARGALVLSLATFGRWLLGPGSAAVLAFALGLFAMGFEVPAAVVASLLGLESWYPGNGSYEVNTFGLLFGAPHAALAMALTLALPLAYHSYLQRPMAVPLLGLACAALALALLHPFHLAPLFLALIADAAVRWRGGTPSTALAPALAVPLLLAVPYLTYAAVTFNFDPFWGQTYGAQNRLPSPQPWELPIDYGVVLLLAVPGALALVRRPSPGSRWLLIWVALMLATMYLPVPYQRRLSFGLQPTLAVLAAAGLALSEGWARPFPGRVGRVLARWLRPAALGLAYTTTATVWVAIVVSAVANAPLWPYRVSAAEAEASAWLATAMGPTEVVLAQWDTSNYLAGRVPGRVVGGHPVATIDPDRRMQELTQFFVTDDAERRRLVAAHGVDYVFHGSRERALGSLADTPWLKVVFQGPGVTVYAVGVGR